MHFYISTMVGLKVYKRVIYKVKYLAGSFALQNLLIKITGLNDFLSPITIVVKLVVTGQCQ